MKPAFSNLRRKHGTSGFTLVELMVAMSIGLILAGTVVLLLIQAATEQRHGYSDATVEESAYTLQANIMSVLRGSSSGRGVTTVSTTAVVVAGVTVGYNSIYVFKPNADGTSFTTSQITANPADGSVVYVPDTATPANKVVWMTNRTSVVLRQLYFHVGANPDGSQNNSLINTKFQMDDNGFSGQNSTNGVPSIQRDFVVQMRCD